MTSLSLRVLPGTYAVCKLPAQAEVPAWALSGTFLSITRTDEELSVVCDQAPVPDGVTAERNWACIKVLGPLDFSLTGILASLATILSEAGISIFAISTYDTDYLLVKQVDVDAAVAALTDAGHQVRA